MLLCLLYMTLEELSIERYAHPSRERRTHRP